MLVQAEASNTPRVQRGRTLTVRRTAWKRSRSIVGTFQSACGASIYAAWSMFAGAPPALGLLGHEFSHRLSDMSGRPLEGCLLIAGEFDLHDGFETAATELARDSDIGAPDPVLALEPGCARQDALLVAN